MEERKLIVILNNKLTDEQLKEIKNEFVNIKIEYLPDDLQGIWSRISAEYFRNKIHLLARQFSFFIRQNNYEIAIIQGEIGITYALVNLLKYTNVYCMYPCFYRGVEDIKNPDGTIKVVQILKHAQFRRY